MGWGKKQSGGWGSAKGRRSNLAKKWTDATQTKENQGKRLKGRKRRKLGSPFMAKGKRERDGSTPLDCSGKCIKKKENRKQLKLDQGSCADWKGKKRNPNTNGGGKRGKMRGKKKQPTFPP